MNRSRTNCAHARVLLGLVPLKLAGKRRSKGQRYYPRPPKALAGSKAVRPSCLEVRATEEPREKGDRQKRHQRCTNPHSRFRGPTQYIRLLPRHRRRCCVRLRALHHPDKMPVSRNPRLSLRVVRASRGTRTPVATRCACHPYTFERTRAASPGQGARHLRS